MYAIVLMINDELYLGNGGCSYIKSRKKVKIDNHEQMMDKKPEKNVWYEEEDS
jgi:hypothetical protein